MIGHLLLFSQAPEKKEATKKEVDLQNIQTPKSDASLPKIDLPEFVITGSERIELNIESKTLDDQERLYTPARPTTGERPMNVGEALSPKHIKSFAKTPGALNGRMFAGFGFYGTPQFDGWFGQYNPTSSIVVNGYYSESNGHVKDAGFWRGGFGVRGSYTLPETSSILSSAQLNGETKYYRDSYRAYASRFPNRVRDVSGVEVSGGIGSRYALPYKSITGLDYSAKTGWSHFSASDTSISSETEFFVNGNASARFLEMAFRASVDYRISSYSMNLPGLQTGHWLSFRADGRQLLTPSFQLSYALQQFVYRGNIQATSGRFYPNIEFRYSFTEKVSLYSGFAPSLDRNTLSSLIKQNRYIHTDAQVLPTDTRIHVYVGMEFLPMDEITATVKLAYKQINNYPTFYDMDSAKVWEVLYLSGIRSTKLDISALYRLNQKQNVTAYFSTQTVKQNDSAGTIPYLPQYTVGSIYHHFFDVGVHAEAFIEFTSSRFSNFNNTHSTSGFLSTGVKGEIELFEHFRGYAELNNLLDQHYFIWNGYRERTIYLLLGISYNW